ncbi:MAG: hypothetical protein DRP58_10535 [Spirochaetes bacterium]|nr:MAG: hypothetical protein DRP58_10535 [Spirochaetota bacterium]
MKENNTYSIDHTSEYIHIRFNRSNKIISSAVLNGGISSVDHILNLKVPLNVKHNDSPDKTLKDFSNKKGWYGKITGMMTAASMNTFEIKRQFLDKTEVLILVTAGLSNARRVGDKADYKNEAGTINIIMYTSAILTEAAMIEAVMIITEAKTAALAELKITSPISGKIATGTGTDSVAVISGQGPDKYNFCGKHVFLGEIIGKNVLAAVRSSIKKAIKST